MTPQEMDELDRWLAENVMGWEFARTTETWTDKGRGAFWCVHEDGSNELICYTDNWSPTRNIAQAWEVLEKVMAPPKTIEHAKRMPNTRFMLWFDSARLWAMTAQEAALEISVNAKKAWEVE